MQALSHCGCIYQIASADFAGDVAVQSFEFNFSLRSVHGGTPMWSQVPANNMGQAWEINIKAERLNSINVLSKMMMC